MRRIFLIAIPIVVAALIALLVVSLSGPKGDTDLEEEVTNAATPPPPTAPTTTATPIESAQVQVQTVSRMFSERYTSTSSLHPTANLSSALPYVSTSLKSAFERTIANPPKVPAEQVTVVSRALAFYIQYVDEKIGRSGVTVTLQRTERKGSSPARVFSQDLVLQLVREGSDWKVNLAVFSQ